MTLIMGVLNVTPDSFSDGGRYADTDAAIAHGVELAAQGADIVDVGGESTRPGAERVPVAAELGRVVPVIRELCGRGIRVSIDTMNSGTARAAIEAGVTLVNDVSGGLADPAMAGLVAERGLDYIANHWRGHSASMDDFARYDDAPHDVRDELSRRVDALTDSGVERRHIILDPGLGFAKTGVHNWQLLGRIGELEQLGLPIMIGASRKRFLAALLPEQAPMEDRDLPTAVISALAARAGVWGVRVHDIPSTRIALDVVRSWCDGAVSDFAASAPFGATGRMEG